MTEGARHIEEVIAEAVERRLSERFDELYDLLREAGSHSVGEIAKPGGLISGLDPNGLYSVSFLADRWDVTEDFVYRLKQKNLPRAAWPGREIRFRGSDILKAEKIETDAVPIHRIGPNKINRPPGARTRPYAKDLPNL